MELRQKSRNGLFLSPNGINGVLNCSRRHPLYKDRQQPSIGAARCPGPTPGGLSLAFLPSGRRFEQDLELMLADGGVRAAVIGTTPIAGNGLGGRRYEEIAGWLAACTEPVESFAILDDEPDMGPLRSFLVRTELEKGLTEEIAERAIQRFAKEGFLRIHYPRLP
jgi:hypothetical protein